MAIRAPGSESYWQLVVLRQVVGDLVPRRLRAHVDVRRRPDRRRVSQRAEIHVHGLPILNQGVQEAAASSAMGVVAVRVAEEEEPVRAGFDRELRPLDAGEGLERGTRAAPALRAVAIQRVAKGVLDGEPDHPAEATAGKARHEPGGGCQSSILLPSGSMTQPNLPYSESSVLSRTLQPSARRSARSAARSATR